eukprot:4835079-Pleurochrysis_carterae.AAC.1
MRSLPQPRAQETRDDTAVAFTQLAHLDLGTAAKAAANKENAMQDPSRRSRSRVQAHSRD